MFSLSNVLHFFAHELACLSGRRLTFAFVFARPFHWFFFRHTKIVSLLIIGLDVTKIAGMTPETPNFLPILERFD